MTDESEIGGILTDQKDAPAVATSGTVDRQDVCVTCGEPMLYRVDEAGQVLTSFCGNMSKCPASCLEIPDAD